jgi:hypothetical protein
LDLDPEPHVRGLVADRKLNAPSRFAILALAAAVVLVPTIAAVTGAPVPYRNDYAAYWPVANLLIDGRNPYDPGAIAELQESVGDELGGDSVVRYPPWSLPILLPLASLPYAPGWYLWIALQLVLALIAALVFGLWSFPRARADLSVCCCLLFSPTLIMALGGQIGGLLLLAAVVFLWSAETGRQVLAGVSLAVLTMKPHLFVPLALCAVLWSLAERRFVLPLSSASAIAAGAICVDLLRPGILGDYAEFVRVQTPRGYLPVSAGGLVRALFGVDQFWLQWIPLALAVPVVFWVWRRFAADWNWMLWGPFLLAFGLLVAPYGLVHDLVLLVPCIVWSAAVVTSKRDLSARRTFFVTLVLVSTLIWIGQVLTGSSFVQIWVAPVVLTITIILAVRTESWVSAEIKVSRDDH